MLELWRERVNHNARLGEKPSTFPKNRRFLLASDKVGAVLLPLPWPWLFGGDHCTDLSWTFRCPRLQKKFMTKTGPAQAIGHSMLPSPEPFLACAGASPDSRI